MLISAIIIIHLAPIVKQEPLKAAEKRPQRFFAIPLSAPKTPCSSKKAHPHPDGLKLSTKGMGLCPYPT